MRVSFLPGRCGLWKSPPEWPLGGCVGFLGEVMCSLLHSLSLLRDLVLGGMEP